VSSESFRDTLGTPHLPAQEPARIVSLVPSITELLFELGLGGQVVGRTCYCIHPADRIGAIPRVGGTKKVKHQLIRALKPTHVILNIDENTRQIADRLSADVPNIIVTHPNTPRDNPALYRLLGGVFHRRAEAERLCELFDRGLRDLCSPARKWRYREVIYLIWKDPWMTVSRDTYIANMLALVNWHTLPECQQPRYPTLELSPELVAQADLVLLSTEPYRFDVVDLETLGRNLGLSRGGLALIDGEMISWYGNRAIAGIRYLADFAERFSVD
jgi:ABC-type Fe3+-hydroxamate transport system substrate-binding protein